MPVGSNLKLSAGVAGIGQATSGVTPQAAPARGLSALGLDPSKASFWAWFFFVASLGYIFGVYGMFGGIRRGVL